MTSAAQAWVTAVATIAACAFVAGLVFFTMCGGCAAELPDYGITITHSHDAAAQWP